MASPRQGPRKSRAPRSHGVPLGDDHTESQAIAYEITTRFNDLTPSVEGIMKAGLAEAGRLRAITLFRDSLKMPGDPHRIPANAIAAGRLVDEASA